MDCTIRLHRLEHGRDIAPPAYASDGAAGMDLRAAVPDDAPLVLEPGHRTAVPTGFAMQVPAGFEGQIRPRSGLALKHGVTVANAPGTLDSDYRGEVKILLINLGAEPFRVERGMRIAQLVVAPVARAALTEAQEMEETGRGTAGFGSTGLQ